MYNKNSGILLYPGVYSLASLTPMDHNEADWARMRYYLPELREKFAQNPNSLPLRNGIAHIGKVLGLDPTVSPVDPLKFLDIKIQQEKSRKNC